MLDNAYNNDSEVRKLENSPGENADYNNVNAAQTAVVKAEPPRFVAPTHSGVDILKLLSELEDLVENTPKRMGVMFRFDDEKFHYLIMKIRANLPEEMKRASKLARDSERIVEESRENAERILAEARESALAQFEGAKEEAVQLHEAAQTEARRARDAAAREADKIQNVAKQKGDEIVAAARAEAAQLVSDSEIVQQALAQAADLQARAEAEANAVRQGADDYARDVLTNLEAVLGKAVTQVQRGREMLERH